MFFVLKKKDSNGLQFSLTNSSKLRHQKNYDPCAIPRELNNGNLVIFSLYEFAQLRSTKTVLSFQKIVGNYPKYDFEFRVFTVTPNK